MIQKIKALLSRAREALDRYDARHHFTCDICGRELFSGERVCARCLGALPFNDGPVCPFCGRQVAEGGTCMDCKTAPLAADRARSRFLHKDAAAGLVLRFKRGERYLAETLAELIAPLLEQFPDADALAFVPMTERAERKRGYNQTELLARVLSARTGIGVLSALSKTRETAAQKALGRKERAENLKGCFHVFDRKGVRGKRIVLVDDTLTTGATAGEIARVLKRAGAERVYLLTVTSVPYRSL